MLISKIWGKATRTTMEGWKKSLGVPETKILKSRNFLTELRKVCTTIPTTSIHYRDSDYYYTDIEYMKKFVDNAFWKAGISGADRIKYISEKRDCDFYAMFTVAMAEFVEVNAMWRLGGNIRWLENRKYVYESHAFNLFYATQNGIGKFFVLDMMFGIITELKENTNGYSCSDSIHNADWKPLNIVE